MIYLFGIWHEYQCYGENNDDKADLLKEAVKKAIEKKGVTLLAEEFNEDSFKDPDNSQTVLQFLEREDDDLKHIFCEMSAEKRAKEGILSRPQIRHQMFMHDEEPDEDVVREKERSYYPAREAHWLSVLKDYTDQNVLFVCGADHISSFGELLDENDIESEVLEEEFDR